MLDNVQKADDYKNNSGQRTVNIKKMNGRWNAVYEIGRGSIGEIVDIIKTAKLPHSDTVIIGDNSSGKSLLLNKIIESQEKEKNLYL